MPQVSVIIPAYGHAEYILQTLDSVFAQTFTDYEVIVVNDGSPDHTAEVLRPLVDAGKIRYFEQTNQGVAAARNFGISQANGEFIALLDDDDLWPPDKLARQVEWLSKHSEHGVVVSWEVLIDSHQNSGGLEGSRSPQKLEEGIEIDLERLFCGNPILSPGQTIIRKTLIHRIGGFRIEYWGSDDYDFWFRAAKVGRIGVCPGTGLHYRLHESNASKNRPRMVLSCCAVMRANRKGISRSRRFQMLRSGHKWIYDWGLRDQVGDLRICLAGGKLGSGFRHLRGLLPVVIREPYMGWLMARYLFSDLRLRKIRQWLTGEPSCRNL